MESTVFGESIAEYFNDLQDPRHERTRLHKLVDILVIALCAVICKADSWEDVASFGKAKEGWFRKFLELPNGIPSHDTFNRVFARLNAKQFETCFIRWVEATCNIAARQIVALDGKLPRGSRDGTLGRGAIDVVSAWATENGLVLGQVKVDEKSNEITAIPELLCALEISGCTVTIDAMGCQTEIARQIVKENHADYVLALKANPGRLYEDVVCSLWIWRLARKRHTILITSKPKTRNTGEWKGANVGRFQTGTRSNTCAALKIGRSC